MTRKSHSVLASPSFRTVPSVDSRASLLYYQWHGCDGPDSHRLSRGRVDRDHPHRLHVPVMDPGAETSGRNPFRAGGPARLAVALSMCVLLSALPASADIYRWVDGQGNMHFTDDLSNIPPSARGSATPVVREGPGSRGTVSVMEPSPDRPAAFSPTESSEGAPRTPESDASREGLQAQIEQWKAKISAKEQHIQAVDRKRSLALNPLRNRLVDEADLDLYRKYQDELPGDREQLQRLEEELSSVR